MYSKTATRLIKNLSTSLNPRLVRTSTSSENDKNGATKKEEVVLPPQPNDCCMSGCPNCVWIKYAQEVAAKFDNGDVIARQKISESVKDPALRAFLLTTLGLAARDRN